MRKILLGLAIPFLALGLNAQIRDYGDTIKTELITFDVESEMIFQATPTTSVFEIGHPQKSNFLGGIDDSNAMVTGAKESYPPNNHSWFDIGLDIWEWFPLFKFDFYYKLNTTHGKDGGYISISYDNRNSWQNIILDSSYNFFSTPTSNDWFDNWAKNKNLYSVNDTLYNGEPGFSGDSLDWKNVQFAWVVSVPCGARDWVDSVYVRFNFISDGEIEEKDGWLIDNLSITAIDLGGNVHDVPLRADLQLYPNPVKETGLISSKSGKIIEKYELFDLQGRQIAQKPIHASAFVFERSNLKEGKYLLRCTMQNGEAETIKLVLD
jgi:hypothetical protein